MKPGIPTAGPTAVLSFLRFLAEHGGRCPLARVARSLHYGLKQLLPLVDTAQLLGLVDVQEDEVVLSELGREFATSPSAKRKVLEAELLQRLQAVQEVLDELHAGGGRAEAVTIAQRLGDPGADLSALVTWGRSAGLWRYDSHRHIFLAVRGH